MAEPEERPREDDTNDAPPAKKPRLETHTKGTAPIKAEYLVDVSTVRQAKYAAPAENDEQYSRVQQEQPSSKRKKKGKGQNTQRTFGSSRDTIKLCMSRINVDEFAPQTCQFGDKCKYEHDLRKYLADGKRENLETFGGKCPVYDAKGVCGAGWKCRFISSHSEERDTEDGRKEMVLLGNEEESARGTFNSISPEDRIKLHKRQMATPKSEPYVKWLNDMAQEGTGEDQHEKSGTTDNHGNGNGEVHERRAAYVEQPFLPSEKRRLYYGPETPVLAPLTTQGNLPFRRLCVDLGAQLTWSEMAMSLPLIQGDKSEWALMRCHESEAVSPLCNNPPAGYDSTVDTRFGVQLAGNKPWMVLKATEILTQLCPSLRAIDLNCGCPIDLVYKQGAGSALLDSPGKLEKILRGMNAVSGEVPVTVKIRMGTKDHKPTANKLIDRLAFGGPEAQQYDLGPCGVAAITLHGRSRQQRYTRSADWEYIAECAATVKRYNEQLDIRTDTIREPDARDAANGQSRLYFIGNGDCYSHEDYNRHVTTGGVDSVLVARGALIKPWIFEEITTGQHLDKSATERLAYIERFARYGLQVWGSDEIGVGTTRRFLLEWLSFACRYVPVGILEHLPPNIQDRPPAFHGRNELETLLSSDNFRDWITISEMFLGKAHPDFRFEPKHKSNAYEINAEG